jgi:alpha-N-arabinofuranosidase
MVETQNGEWWSVFLGCRPYADNHYNIGRETFLMPVRWMDGWPVITAGEETVPYVVKKPDLPAAPAVQRSGNFRFRDDFDAPALAPDWNFVRTPRDKWHDLTSTPDR